MSSSSKSVDASELLFLGTHGHVIALSKKTGRKVWATSLPGTGWSVVSILFEEGQLFCASGGRAFCLDPVTGEVIWSNGLKGFGQGLVYLTSALSNDTEALMSLLSAEAANRAAAASAATT